MVYAGVVGMGTDCVIFGCGSQARYVIDNLRSHGLESPRGMVDLEGNSLVSKVIDEVPVLWGRQQALDELDPESCEVIVAHGDNGLKMDVAKVLEARGFRFMSSVHRQAIISPTAHIGGGCIVNAAAALLPNAVLESHVVVHSGSIIEHDCVVGEGANISPGVILAGRVCVGREAYVYTGSCVIPNVEIGARAVVGAGAVVLENVPEGACVVGNPARRIR